MSLDVSLTAVRSTEGTYKISGLGWLCRKVEGRWVVLFKLTPDQLKEVNIALNELIEGGYNVA